MRTVALCINDARIVHGDIATCTTGTSATTDSDTKALVFRSVTSFKHHASVESSIATAAANRLREDAVAVFLKCYNITKMFDVNFPAVTGIACRPTDGNNC